MSGIQCTMCKATTEFIDGKTELYCAGCYGEVVAERDRLRDALREIAAYTSLNYDGQDCHNMITMAKEALNE